MQRVVGGWQNVFANMRKGGGGGRVSDEVTPQCGANGGSNGSCQQSATDAVAERRHCVKRALLSLSGGANGGGGCSPVRLPAPTIRRVSDDEPELEAWERESMRSSLQDEEGGFTRARPTAAKDIK